MAKALYNVVSGLCLLLVIVLYTRMVGKVSRSETRDNYLKIITISIIYLTGDVLWGIIYADLLPIPIFLQKLIYAFYYSGSAILSYRWFIYVEFMQGSLFYKNHIAKQISRIPMLFVVASAVASIWTKWFFYIDEVGNYCRGEWYIPQLVFTYGYIVFAFENLAS